MTVKQKWAAVSSTGPVGDEGSSSVSSSHDTWKGLAPVSRDAEGPSDQVSFHLYIIIYGICEENFCLVLKLHTDVY